MHAFVQIIRVYSSNILSTSLRVRTPICGAQVIVAFSTFLTSYSSFKKQALACDYNLDARQELYALGAAGVFGSFFGAFPPSGSLSRTGLAVQLGVKSQICGICTAATVAAGLIFLAPALEDLPKASLAAIVMASAEGLMDFQMPLHLWRSSTQTFRSSFRKDLLVWMVGFLCTILAGALYGIVLSVLVAIAQVVAEAATPKASGVVTKPRLVCHVCLAMCSNHSLALPCSCVPWSFSIVPEISLTSIHCPTPTNAKSNGPDISSPIGLVLPISQGASWMISVRPSVSSVRLRAS